MEITHLTQEEFLNRAHKDYTVLSDGTENHPREYFFIQTAKEAGVYLSQVDIGLTKLPALEMPDLSLCMMASSFRLFCIESQTATVVDTLDLTTTCIELVRQQNRVAIICEAEVILYDISSCTCLQSIYLPDAIQEILPTPEAVTLLLYDGTRVMLDTNTLLPL